MKYKIGDFSKIIRLPVKTLHYYHEMGILIPAEIDNLTGYRLYDDKDFEKAQIIIELRSLNFSINQIKEILSGYNEDMQIIDYFIEKQNELSEKIKEYKNIQSKLLYFLKQQELVKMTYYPNEIIEKFIPDINISSIRFSGKYNEVGNYFSKLGKVYGRYICGSAFSLYHDGEYKDEGADIECGYPISKNIKNDIKVTCLKGGSAYSIIHKGSYETIGNSYKHIFNFFNTKKLNMKMPIREIYHKGPGIIFKGNPKNFITEIQIFF